MTQINQSPNATQNTQTPKGLSPAELKKIDDKAQDFEAVFITEMLKPMFAMVETDPVFGGGKGEDVFKNFQLNEYGKMIAKQGGIGLADHVRDQLIHLQLTAKGEDATKAYKYAPPQQPPQNQNTPVSSITDTKTGTKTLDVDA